MTGRPDQLPVVGWREWTSIPGWGVEAIKVKVDTGARTSALHAHDLHRVERDGHTWVRFEVLPWQWSARDPVTVETPLVDERTVTSSSGASEERPVVTAPIRLGDAVHDIEVTLTQRDVMGFRMLLGREALRRRVLVDPGSSYLLGRPSRELVRRNRERP